MTATLALAFLAGVLSILSPCVLPLVPIVFGTAASEHRWGPLALAAGLATSFVALGLFVALVGFSIGLDAGVFRMAGAILLIVIGVALGWPRLQTRLAAAGGPMADWSQRRLGGLAMSGPLGPFGVGLLLGAVWSPCVGPTLGAATVLAAQGRDLGAVALTMLAFGLGAALPMLLLGGLARAAMLRWRSRLIGAGTGLKAALGVALILVGLAIVTGTDRTLETRLVDASPPWLSDLTARY